MLETGFSTSEVSHPTGIIARQLQWWDEHGLVLPVSSGRRRLSSLTDRINVMVLEVLRTRRRFSLIPQRTSSERTWLRIAPALHQLRRAHSDVKEGAAVS